MFGASLFAMATALWPTRAFAAEGMINVADNQYWCLTLTQFSSFTSSDISVTMNNNETATLDNLRGIASTNYKYQDMAGLSNSSTIYVLSTVSSGALTKGMKFWLDPNFGNISYYDTTSNMSRVDIMPSQYKYFGRSSNGTWYDLTPENGLFTAPARLNFVCVAANARGSSALNNHAYCFSGTTKLDVYVSMHQTDVVSAIEGQTTDINDQSQQNTQDILDGQNNQTDELKDTTGSNTIASGALTQGQDMYQNFSVNQLVDSVTSNISQAVNSTESDSVVTFPGMSLMGFTIQPVSIDPMTQLPVIADTIKLIVTFTFSAAFLRHIIELVHAIFGIYDYGDSSEMFGDSEQSSNHVYEG